MATFTKKANGKWLVQVRHKAQNGKPEINKASTFDRKADAQAWASKIETDWQLMRAGLTPKLPFSEVIERYLNEVTPTKGGQKSETLRLKRILKTPLATVLLNELSDIQLRQWVDKRLTEVSNDAVIREWSTISHVLTVTVKEWRLLPENYMLRMKKPQKSKPRTRRVTEEEIEKICLCSGYSKDNAPLKQTQRVGAAFCFAIETAMRQGEIAGLLKKNVFLDENYVHLETTKNGESRNVPLSPEAKIILKQVMSAHNGLTAFQVPAASMDAQFRKIKKLAMIEDLHFHDTRREAITRLCKLYEPMELAKISGHKDLRVLLNTYYAPSAPELAEKMHANSV
ncbi:site-specific integrase [Vitreoscilla massiliensis]|uniref:Site-specific integrase n=1 Tax=Vitreoscilla massiliensis TaxID=1689272 RepID=A0ABY4E752_9NEIS|nr:site-specific integrase [Vitreoscilla massiliensis]UOO89202.1 site-specific integrase [Vitreoscilla massiliensis]